MKRHFLLKKAKKHGNFYTLCIGIKYLRLEHDSRIMHPVLVGHLKVNTINLV